MTTHTLTTPAPGELVRAIQWDDGAPMPMRNTIGHNAALLRMRGFAVIDDAHAGSLHTVTMRRIDPTTCAHETVTLREWKHGGQA